MSRNTSQIKPQQALQSYLDGLLHDAFVDLEETEIDEFALAVQEERQRDAVPRLVTGRPMLEVPADRPLVLQTLRLPEISASVPVVPVPACADVPLVEEQNIQPTASERDENSLLAATVAETAIPSARPDWSQEPFECLLFDVAGLTLAVPLVSLGSIYSLEGQELTPLFGQPQWYLGLLPSQSGNLRVLDTARWVLAERYKDEFKDNLRYVISVQGYEWGLAVHQVSRSIRLNPSEVKWRSERSQRPWLAGTVIEHMCALLDVQSLAQLIETGGQHA